jgi:hypothetical protein
VRLQIAESPSAKDFIQAGASVAELRIALITPSGQRVTEQNVVAHAFTWQRQHDLARDSGRNTTITFATPGSAGLSVLETSAAPDTAKAKGDGEGSGCW